jgi:hypothetical protein
MYSILDTKKLSELYVIRQGWFSHEYELTDNVYSYGKITYYRLSGRRATVTTVTGTWVFQRESLFSRTISITDQNGVIIGSAHREIFSRKTILKLESGFQAGFYRPSIWAREYIWESDGYGKMMHMRSNLFSLRGTIYIDQSLVPVALTPLLAFFGAYLVIISRRRRSKH